MAGLLDFLYGGQSTQLNPTVDDSAMGTFSMDQGQNPPLGVLGRMMTMPGWAKTAANRATTVPGWIRDANSTAPSSDINLPVQASTTPTNGPVYGTGIGTALGRLGGAVAGSPTYSSPGSVPGQDEDALSHMQPDASGIPTSAPGTVAPLLPPAIAVGGDPRSGADLGPRGPLNQPMSKSADVDPAVLKKLQPKPADVPKPTAPVQDPLGSAGNVLGRIQDYLHRHSNMLIAMGAGMAGGRSFGEGLSAAGAGALRAQQMDIGMQQREATIQALMGRGYSRQDAEAIAGQPHLLPQFKMITGISGQQEPGVWDPLRQTFMPTKVEKPEEGAASQRPDGASQYAADGKLYVVKNGKWHLNET